MSYFLKSVKSKKGEFLEIAVTVYNKETKLSNNKVYKKLGYAHQLKNDKVKDPISYYKKVCKKMNEDERKKKEENRHKLIGENIVKNFGYFVVKSLFNTLKLDKELNYFKYMTNLNISIPKFIEGLTYSRIIKPCSKLKTFSEVLPTLYEDYNFTLDEIYDGIEFIGSEYEKFIEVLNHCINNEFKRNTNVTFFDCTNYFFEIDFEKDDKQKGPSKENRPSPIIGQALILDKDSIPLGMKMYPGNESEKPKLREMIKDLKTRNNIKGRTIQIADKGLNCGDNIYAALKDKDGYIFSQSVMQLPEIEKKWILLNNDFKDIKDEHGNIKFKVKSCIDEFPINITLKGKKITIKVKQKRVVTFNPSLAKKKKLEINKLVEKAKLLCLSQSKKEEYGESSKYVNFVDKNGDKAKTQINQEKINKDLMFAGYNLLVTSEIDIDDEEIIKAYHSLWNIENTFRILKSELDARPIYMQKRNSIYGHFLICYYAVTFLRILEEKIFNRELNVYDLKELIKSLNLCKLENQNINLSRASNDINKLSKFINFPLNHMYFTEAEIRKLFRCKYKFS